MRDLPFNKYRAAMDVLRRGHDLLIEGLAEEVLDRQESLLEGGSSSTSSSNRRAHEYISSA